eukprot:EG_transcript_336
MIPSVTKDDPSDPEPPPKKTWKSCFRKKSKPPPGKDQPTVTFLQLFRFSDRADKWLMAVGALCGIVVGGTMPAMTLLFGKIMNDLNSGDRQRIEQKVSDLSLWLTLLGIGSFLLNALGMALFSISGDRQGRKMRWKFFSAILDQEVAFFDCCKAGELTSHISSDVQIVSTLLGSKIFLLISYMSTFVISYIFAFIQSWSLTLVMLGVTPLIAISAAVMARVLSTATTKIQEVYATAGAIAQEVLSAIRTVHAFDGMEREAERYGTRVAAVEKIAIKKGLWVGLSQGVTMCIMFWSYAIAFYFGSYLIEWNWNSPGDVLSVFFTVLIGARQAGLASPIFSNVAEARGAAQKIFGILDRQPAMDAKEGGVGQPVTSTKGHIEFRNVAFTYPARPDLPIFKGFNLEVQPGQRVALVGPSGSGKSSIVALIQRFYDPEEGDVLVDGVPLRHLNLHSWRDKVGIVTQEPILFQTTVMENIRCVRPDVSEEEVIQACKDAFIHDVISKLPDGYNTVVGESGSQLSGGQKQRVAIARAIVKDPRVLLLDEATSALDRQSEAIVQEALNNVMRGRTVVTIAHRLVTIQDSDLICYIQPRDAQAPPDSPAATSRVLESGTHEQLMSLGGEYSNMVFTQNQVSQHAHPVVHTTGAGATVSKEAEEADAPVWADMAVAVKEEPAKKGRVIRRTAKISKPERWYIGFGVLGSALVGTSWPIYAILFSEIVNVFYEKDMREQVWKWCLLFVGLGLLDLCSYTIKGYCLNYAGERLTARLRTMLFRAMLSQDIGFFDVPGNESGALCTRLAADTTEIQHLWGGAIGANVQAVVCMGAGVIIAYVVSWELALVVSSSIPAVVLAKVCQNRVMFNLAEESGKGMDQCGQVATESINGHRTVFAFNLQDYQVGRYRTLLVAPAKADKKKAVVSGVFYGFSQFVIFGSFALAYWYGGKMIGQGRLTFNELLKCSFALLMGAIGVGEVYAMAGDQAGAKLAAIRVYEMLDRVPPIDSVGNSGQPVTSLGGSASFSDVHFAYPSRPTVPILQGLNLAFQEGQRVAIMGSTGCGKSTIIALLMRYYDPSGGEVRPDGLNLRDLNLRSYRRWLGIVSQEPILFDDTVANNIRYGKPDATDEEVFEAARQAHIHDVICSLPDGYTTNVGAKGSQLSGGQKQRVAIARCIIRHPAVLLLDEATSALDNVSEREVQAALDHIVMTKRMTVITVAHRLSTIKNCNLIVIMDGGKVVEMGSHAELYALGGDYTRRYNQYYGIRSHT